MSRGSLRRRILAGLFGVRRRSLGEVKPPVTEGYSVCRRVLGGLLGVAMPDVGVRRIDVAEKQPSAAEKQQSVEPAGPQTPGVNYRRFPVVTTPVREIEGEVLEFGEWSKYRTRKKFAARLNLLFETVHPAGRKPHTNGEVAAALTATGHPISKTYLAQLRSGTRSTPSEGTITALAKFFKVEPDYFYNDVYAAKIDRDLVLLSQLQAVGLRRLSSRAFDLSEESQKLLTSMAEKLRASEGLPEIPPDGAEWQKSTR